MNYKVLTFISQHAILGIALSLGLPLDAFAQEEHRLDIDTRFVVLEVESQNVAAVDSSLNDNLVVASKYINPDGSGATLARIHPNGHEEVLTGASGFSSGGSNRGRAINSNGDVAHFVEQSDGSKRAALWSSDHNEAILLGSEFALESRAAALNNQGVSVGFERIDDGGLRTMATGWRLTGAKINLHGRLERISGARIGYSTAYDINDSGVVVGGAGKSFANLRPFCLGCEQIFLEVPYGLAPQNCQVNRINNQGDIFGICDYDSAPGSLDVAPIVWDATGRVKTEFRGSVSNQSTFTVLSLNDHGYAIARVRSREHDTNDQAVVDNSYEPVLAHTDGRWVSLNDVTNLQKGERTKYAWSINNHNIILAYIDPVHGPMRTVMLVPENLALGDATLYVAPL